MSKEKIDLILKKKKLMKDLVEAQKKAQILSNNADDIETELDSVLCDLEIVEEKQNEEVRAWIEKMHESTRILYDNQLKFLVKETVKTFKESDEKEEEK